ncbi:methionyl-tRNA formyltransferase [Candidatus Falkowbacteria bacterium]|nr:methionyl-tRNA formyltransferase [Candidatus Falkowbacteria bacterium]
MSKVTNNKIINVVFMGTPEFAIPGLKALIANSRYNVKAVYTKVDKPQGRGKKLSASPVKILAQEHNIPVYQPNSLKTEIHNIAKINPDLIVVIAYGKILPREILELPRYACINVHGSLLPLYRGSACLNAPIINGDKKTGISIMKINESMDTGPILKQFEIELNSNSNLEYVHNTLSKLSGQVLVPTLNDWIDGKLEIMYQDNDKASYVKMLKKEDGKIDWQKKAITIDRLIRGLNPWPGTFTHINNKLIKIITAQVAPNSINKNHKVGEVFLESGHLTVKCGQGNLFILKLQIEGGKIMSSSDFISGHSDIIGQILK